MDSVFSRYWSDFSTKSLDDRRTYFESLTETQRDTLLDSFFDEGWHELFIQDFLDQSLDFIKNKFDIDLISLRIQAIKHGRVFLIEKSTWDLVEHLMCIYSEYYDINKYFGGLLVEAWGRRKQFYRIRAIKDKWR